MGFKPLSGVIATVAYHIVHLHTEAKQTVATRKHHQQASKPHTLHSDQPPCPLTLFNNIYHGDVPFLDLSGGQLSERFDKAFSVVECRLDRGLSKADS